MKRLAAIALFLAAPVTARAQFPCPSCAEWLVPQQPIQLFANTYYVGTHGLSAILITSKDGDILIDGGLPESAPLIRANIAALGFRVRDVKLILNSHAHFDHAGGIAALQRASGATVAASPWSASVLKHGASQPGDPQFGALNSFPPVDSVRVIGDGDTLRVGSLALTAHFTAGHTPGGTTWTWQSCDGQRCVSFVYADSQTPVSADDFHFTNNSTYPNALADFEHGLQVIDSLSCDVLLTPHPGASRLWERLAADSTRAVVDRLMVPNACHAFVTESRAHVAQRVAQEQGK